MKLRTRPTFPLYVAALCAALTILQIGLYIYSGEAIALIVAVETFMAALFGAWAHRTFAGKRS